MRMHICSHGMFECWQGVRTGSRVVACICDTDSVLHALHVHWLMGQSATAATIVTAAVVPTCPCMLDTCWCCSFGESDWDERRASLLRAMLRSAVLRRFPQGLRVHIYCGSSVRLQELFGAMRRHALTITRCAVGCRLPKRFLWGSCYCLC